MRSVIFILTLCMLLPMAASAQQSQAELERRRQNILNSIKETQAELAATKKDKTASLADLRAVQMKLDARQRLIGSINEEIQSISGTIQQSSQEVTTLQSKLEGLKARYAQSVRYAYQNRNSYNMMAFLFSAQNYNEAIRRIKYLKRYRDYRKQQVEEIYLTQGKLKEKIGTLSTEKSRKDLLLNAENQQKMALLQETNEKNRVVTELKGREKELLVQIAKDQKDAQKTERAIQQVIARQIELERKRAQEEMRRRQEAEAKRLADAKRAEDKRKAEAAAAATAARNSGVMVNTGSGTRPANGGAPVATNNPPASNPRVETNPAASASTASLPPAAVRNRPAPTARELSMTPEAIALSNSFASNRGRLPWPVERGAITGNFGNYKHPIAKNVILNHPGILIQTSPGAPARAVFGGKVTVAYLGTGVLVMINHGEYTSVYANLASVSVKSGDEVTTRQNIGTVGQDSDGLPTLDFQIWKGMTKLDPAGWIAR